MKGPYELSNNNIKQCFSLDSATLKLWNIDQWSKELNKTHSKAYGFFEGKELIGVCVHQKIISEAELIFLTIHPSFRRRGLGTKLIENLFDICRTENLERIILEVSSKNIKAMDFYKRCGFETIGTRVKYYKDGSDAYLKEKKV